MRGDECSCPSQDCDLLDYEQVHRRIRKELGPADLEDCIDCGKPARHWAMEHGKCRADPRSYMAMCVSCHNFYDKYKEESTA